MIYYNNAEVNSIVVRECDGSIRNVNKAFTTNFGYQNEDITGRHFKMLFTLLDRQTNRPQLELDTILSKGQSYENFIVDKKGQAIWCTGESILVTGEEGKNYIVKDIVNLQTKGPVQLFLSDTEELLERIFATSKNLPMLILDGSLKIQRVNAAFLRLFELPAPPAIGSRLSDLEHSFWNNEEIKQELSKSLVTNEPFRQKEFLLSTNSGKSKTIWLDSKIIDSQAGMGKIIYILIDEVYHNVGEK